MEEKKINNISSVCVYCASSTKIPSVYFDAAKELGRLLGERKLRVVNGAGNIGLMCAVSDAALAAGGTVTGVIPHFMVEQDWYHKGLTELIEVETMHERKHGKPLGCGDRPSRWMRYIRGTSGDHHLETTRSLPQSDRNPQY